MRNMSWILGVAVGALAVANIGAQSRCTLGELCSQAEEILEATIMKRVSKLEDGGKTIRSYVTVVGRNVIDGKSRRLVLRLEGGQVGKQRLVVSPMPRLVVGRRYLLFVRNNGRALSPIVGMDQGAFEIVKHEGRSILASSHGDRLQSVSKGRLVFSNSKSDRKRITFASFVGLVRAQRAEVRK